MSTSWSAPSPTLAAFAAAFQKLETKWIEFGNLEIMTNTFERDLQSFPNLTIERVVLLGSTDAKTIIFLKNLVTLLKKVHSITKVYIQSNNPPDKFTAFLETLDYTIIFDDPNPPNGEQPIWSKISTTTLLIAPLVPPETLHKALKWSGFAILICADIDDIVTGLRPSNGQWIPGAPLEFFIRVQRSAFKRKMPLLAGAEAMCEKTSINWVFGGGDNVTREMACKNKMILR